MRNLTPVTELNDEKIFDEPRATGDGSKLGRGLERDGTGDGSQSPLPPNTTTTTQVYYVPYGFYKFLICSSMSYNSDFDPFKGCNFSDLQSKIRI